MLLAQAVKVCAGAPSSTAMLAPSVMVGGWFTEATVMLKVLGRLVLLPPLAVPPLFCSSTVTLATPLETGAMV